MPAYSDQTYSTDNPAWKALRRLCDATGSQKAVALKLGFTGPFICDVLYGRRPVSAKLAKALGFRRVVTFVYEPEK